MIQETRRSVALWVFSSSILKQMTVKINIHPDCVYNHLAHQQSYDTTFRAEKGKQNRRPLAAELDHSRLKPPTPSVYFLTRKWV